MNLIVRNLLHVLRRFKLAAILNILGLSVAFAAFMVIMMQLNFHFGFDKFHKDSDKIFRLETVGWSGAFQTAITRPLAELFIESSPHIIGGTLVQLRGGTAFFHIENNGVRNYFRENTARATPEFTDVFSFDFVEGSKDALKMPENVIIPLSLSRKFFGNESAIGKHLIHEWGTQTVGAVYRDLPLNSILKNFIYTTIPDDENKQNWHNSNYVVFLRVNDAANAPLLVDNFKRNFDHKAVFGEESNWDAALRLTALPDIYFTNDVVRESAGSKQTLLILFAIGIVIIIIAAINFTNFSTALTPMRIKNINTQRVMGAQQSTIRWILVIEAVVFTVVSYLVAILLVKLFADSTLSSLVDADLSFSANSLIVGGTALVAILVGVIAGFYPSRYMTSFAPAIVLKGSFGVSPKGKRLRNTLIGIQFVASLTLIISASFMYLQNRFMQNSDLGYEREALITVNIAQIQDNRDAFTHQLKAYSGIEDVTYAEQILMSSDNYMSWTRPYEDRDGGVFFEIIPVHYTFLDVLGIELTAGRGFRADDAIAERGALIFNETAHRMYDLKLNTMVGIAPPSEIIAFMPDIQFASHRISIDPMALYVWGTDNWGDNLNRAYIKLKPNTNPREAISHIRFTLAEFDPNFPFEVRFFDEVLQRLYEKETQLSLLITLFSLIAIFISIVGVFGLVVFDSECRRKEIGIRKVLGSSTMEIITMFNKTYIKMLLICFVIAAPLAWYAVRRWLENFAYRTPMYWWVYLLALIVVAAITVLTVTIQNWRVANDNPVKSIKTE
jgi:putative ABC transport system permease protein